MENILPCEALMNHSVYQPFLTNAKQALKLCVQYLIDHLRIYTPILVALSTIDPVLYQNLTEETVSFMRQLPRYIKVLNTDERDTYNSELLQLSLTKFPRCEDDSKKNCRKRCTRLHVYLNNSDSKTSKPCKHVKIHARGAQREETTYIYAVCDKNIFTSI